MESFGDRASLYNLTKNYPDPLTKAGGAWHATIYRLKQHHSRPMVKGIWPYILVHIFLCKLQLSWGKLRLMIGLITKHVPGQDWSNILQKLLLKTGIRSKKIFESPSRIPSKWAFSCSCVSCRIHPGKYCGSEIMKIPSFDKEFHLQHRDHRFALTIQPWPFALTIFHSECTDELQLVYIGYHSDISRNSSSIGIYTLNRLF